MRIAVFLALFLAFAAPLRAQDASAQAYVDATAGDGLLLTEMSQQVLDRVPREAVTEVATETIAANRTNAIILGSIAETKGLDMPTSLDDGRTAVLAQIADADNENVAQVYADLQVKTHEDAIATTERYLAEGEDEELKRFADDALRQLQGGLEDAQALQKEVTASNDQQ